MLINWLPAALAFCQSQCTYNLSGRRRRSPKGISRVRNIESLEDRTVLSGLPAVPAPDTYTITQNTPFTATAATGVLANDFDAEGDTLTATAATQPLNGTLLLNPNGSFTYTPNAGFVGADTFTYTVFDGTLTTPLPMAVTLTVNALNIPPVGVPDTYLGSEDSPVVVNAANGVLANDVNGGGGTLTASLVTPTLFGTVDLHPDGSFTYTPTSNFFGIDTFTYTPDNGSGAGAPTAVVITLNSVADIPVGVPDTYLGTEDSPVVVNAANGVLANDINVDNNQMTATLVTPTAFGTVNLNPDGSFTYTPNANFAGVDTFTYTPNTTSGVGVPTAVVITLNGIADIPVGVPDTYLGSEDSQVVVNAANGVLANDINVDGNQLTATLVTPTAFGTLNLNPDGSFTYTPNNNFVGVDTFTYIPTSSSGTGLPTAAVITLNGVADLVVGVPDVYTGTEDSALTVNAANGVLANDINVDGGSMTASLVSQALFGTVALNPDGSFTYTPNANFAGADSFTYSVTNLAGVSVPTAVALTLNPVPDLVVPVADVYTGTEDSALVVNAANGVLANDINVDGGAETATLLTPPLFGNVTLNPDGSFTYTPNANFAGADSFTYTVNNVAGVSIPAPVAITLTGVADTPVAVPDAYLNAEDSQLVVNAANGVLANDIDADGDTLTAAVFTPPQFGTLNLSPNGSFTYTPNANFAGIDTFTYVANDGNSNSLPATVTITMTGSEDAPVAVPDAYIGLTATSLTINAANGVLANDLDFDGDTLTAALVSGPANGTLTLNPNGSFTYTSNAGFAGADAFTYRANDGTLNSLPATVVITVTNGGNGTPVAAADSYAGVEDQTLTVSAAAGVLANDFDSNSDPLTAVLITAPATGSLTLNADGSFVYTPAANVSGAVTFTYAANDGTSSSSPATVTLNLSAVNDVTTAVDDTYSIPQDTALSVTAAIGVLANDIDPDGDTLTAALANAALNGSVVLAGDGSFVYTPNPGFVGTDAFSYTVNDGTTTSPSALVTIHVTSATDTPVAVPDTLITNEDVPLILSAAAGVLANDSDPNSDTLSAILVAGPSHGTLILDPDGSLIYTPNLNFHGADSFTYHATDGALNSADVTVSINVNSVNDLPLAANDAFFVNEDASLTINALNGVLANDSDVDGDALSALVVSQPAHGTLTLNADGSFTYTPSANFTGTDSFTYRANDGTSDSNLATVNIMVNLAQEPPSLIPTAGAQRAIKHRKTLVDPGIQVTDPDSPTFNGGSLEVTIQSNASSKNVLGYRHGGAKKGHVNIKHNVLRVGQTVIGTTTGGKHGSALHVDYNAAATLDRVSASLNALTFQGSKQQPGVTDVQLVVTDDTGLESNPIVKSIEVVSSAKTARQRGLVL